MKREDQLVDVGFDTTQWMCFLDRAAREYLFLHTKHHKNDRMHLYRESVLGSALANVLAQVTSSPFDGDMDDIMAASQPIIEIALDLSGPICEKQETKAWIEQKIADGDYSFKECDQYPA